MASAASDQFFRYKDAEGADHFTALGLGILQFLNAQAVDLRQDKIQIFHALEAAFLGQIDVTVKFPQDLEQPLMGRQVEVEFFPHVIVRCCHLTDLPIKVQGWSRLVPGLLRGEPGCRRAGVMGLFIALGHGVAGLIPGLDAAGAAIDVFVAQPDRPHGAVVAPGAFDETAVEHQGLILVGA